MKSKSITQDNNQAMKPRVHYKPFTPRGAQRESVMQCGRGISFRSVPPAHVLRRLWHQGCDHPNQPLFFLDRPICVRQRASWPACLLAQPSLRGMLSVLLLVSSFPYRFIMKFRW
ncbi:hypothetical protein F5X97DRAFT_282846 [Nemania serpens]|nr:hypothetical protein F5X97DRAFT_282846 [Nemania serpens]